MDDLNASDIPDHIEKIFKKRFSICCGHINPNYRPVTRVCSVLQQVKHFGGFNELIKSHPSRVPSTSGHLKRTAKKAISAWEFKARWTFSSSRTCKLLNKKETSSGLNRRGRVQSVPRVNFVIMRCISNSIRLLLVLSDGAKKKKSKLLQQAVDEARQNNIKVCLNLCRERN